MDESFNATHRPSHAEAPMQATWMCQQVQPESTAPDCVQLQLARISCLKAGPCENPAGEATHALPLTHGGANAGHLDVPAGGLQSAGSICEVLSQAW